MPRETERWIATVARHLDELRDQVVFVGGAILSLLIDEVGSPEPRATDDLDAVINVSSRSMYHALEQRLRELGFRPDMTQGAPLCRWNIDDIVVDIMPTAERLLGFSNRWYAEAMTAASTIEIEPGLPVRIATAPYFIAMKFEAFRDRGERDFIASHDLEDIVSILDGHVNLEAEIAASSDVLRSYLATECRALLDEEAFVSALPGHLPGDENTQARLPRVTARLVALANGGRGSEPAA